MFEMVEHLGEAPVRAEFPLVDEAFLSDAVGDFGPELLAELIDTLAEECAEALVVLDAAVARRDVAGCVAQAHFLKGAALGLGLSALGERASAMEHAARHGVVPAPAAGEELRVILACSLEELRSFTADLEL